MTLNGCFLQTQTSSLGVRLSFTIQFYHFSQVTLILLANTPPPGAVSLFWSVGRIPGPHRCSHCLGAVCLLLLPVVTCSQLDAKMGFTSIIRQMGC